jgi:hypothetical protein
MNKKIMYSLLAVAGMVMGSATEGFSFGSYGTNVNTACAPAAPYTGSCTFCHVSDRGAATPAKDAFLAGGATLTDFFCPSGPTCTDTDGDTYAREGGACGAVDCNDNNAAVHPGAAEVCTDNFDNDCDGLIDLADPNAVGCLAPCSDKDRDGYAVNGGTCGPVDCNDNNFAINPNAVDIANNGIDENCDGVDRVDGTIMDKDGDGFTPAAGDCNDNNAVVHPLAVDIPNNGIDENCDGVDTVDPSIVDNDGDGFTPANGDCNDTNGAINPGAVEICTDGVDNNCNGLVDSQDSSAVNCPSACTDSDVDTYATEGGNCGQVDCDDQNAAISPAAVESCDDGIDNDCDGLIDEGCDVACPDVDGDGYLDAVCGGNDCDDTNAAIHPGAAEVCGNSVDNNCNGASDETCTTCPDGTILIIRDMEYNRGDGKLKVVGNANVKTTITIADAVTGKILASGIKVREGKWSVEIRRVPRNLVTIRASTAEGCYTEQDLQTGDDDDDDDRDRRGRTNRD